MASELGYFELSASGLSKVENLSRFQVKLTHLVSRIHWLLFKCGIPTKAVLNWPTESFEGES